MALLVSIICIIITTLLVAPFKATILALRFKLAREKNKTGTSKLQKLSGSKVSRDVKKDIKSKELKTNSVILALKGVITAIKAFMGAIGALLTTLFAILDVYIVVLVVIFVTIVGSTVLLSDDLNMSVKDVLSSSYGTDSYVPTPINASVQEVINMTETQVWQLISEGRFSSYTEANDAANASDEAYEEEKQYWEGLLTEISFNAWVWTDSSKQTKKSVTKTTRVNKYLAEYFTSFLNDIYACPEQYVIVEIGGYNFRRKNNGTGTSSLSAHSFGTVLDINWNTDGMGSKAAGVGGSGDPWNTDNGLQEPERSEACAYNGHWFQLIKKYGLDWGGNWSDRSLDPMHFSIVGDNKKDGRNYTPKTPGQSP